MSGRILACLLLLGFAACGEDAPVPAHIVAVGAETDASGFVVVDFGEVATGSTGSRTLVLRNDGEESTRLELGPLLAPFAASLQRERLKPGQEAQLELTFRPSQPGSREAIATVEAAGGSIDLRLRGNGTGEAIACLEVQTRVLDFGVQAIGCPGDPRSVSITNGCDHELSLELRIQRGIGAFELVSPSQLVQVAPGGSIEVAVGFSPASTGAVEGTLVATADGMQASVQLVGEGADPERVEREDVFPGWGEAIDLLLVVDEGAATAAYEPQRGQLAKHIEGLARYGNYDLRIAATGTTLEPGSSCGGSGGELLPVGAPDLIEDATWYPDGLTDRIATLLSPPICDEPAMPIEAAARALDLFASEHRSARAALLILSAREDGGTEAIEEVASRFVQQLGDLPLVAVAGPAANCDEEEGRDRLETFAQTMLGASMPVCGSWVDPLERILPRNLGITAAPGFRIPRSFYLGGRPIDRDGDGLVDERDLTVFVQDQELPSRGVGGSHWFFNLMTNEIFFSPTAQPRDIETVRVVYAVAGGSGCGDAR